MKYVDRKQQKAEYIASRPKESYHMKPNDDIFEGNPLEKAKEISEKVKVLKELNDQLSLDEQKSKERSKKKPKQKSAGKPHKKPLEIVKKKFKKATLKNKFTVS